MISIKDDKTSMEELLKKNDHTIHIELGTLVEGKVIYKNRNTIVVDLGGIATGIIQGRETRDSAGTIYSIEPGDDIAAIVVEDENEEGMYVLSLRKASQERAWDRFVKAFNEEEIIEVTAQEVNKGGLLLEIDGIKGFIPVSQLAPLHYPRVDGGDASEIVRRLERLIGQKFLVKIINIDEVTGKLILSEKEAQSVERAGALKKLKTGDRVKGHISGIVKFGIFVTFDGLEGLVHISEIAWGHVSNPRDYGKLGDEVEVLVIGVDDEKISLSMKRLIDDPWANAAKKYEVNTKVKGTINRITPFGAFMKLDDDINGLIHLSEISHDKVVDPTDFINIGDEVEAEVINIDAKEHRIGLSLKSLQEAPANTEEVASTKDTSSEASAKDEKPAKKAAKKEDGAEETPSDKDESSEASAKDEKEEKKPAKKSTKKEDEAEKTPSDKDESSEASAKDEKEEDK